MGATTVVNLKGHRGDPGFADVVYVGRAVYRGGWHLPASALASPFRPGPGCSREDAVARYREYLLGRADLLALLPALRGRRLGCWCAPGPCHAAVIAELADAADPPAPGRRQAEPAAGEPAAGEPAAGSRHRRPGRHRI